MSLADLISQLNVLSKDDSHREVYEVGRKVLKQDPANSEALRQCLVALIQMDNYGEASKLLLDNAKAAESPDLLLEKAYIYYKTGKAAELKALEAQGANSRGFKHIMAQFEYQTGESRSALKRYRELLGDAGAELSDLAVNERAVISQIKYEDSSSTVEPTSEGTAGSYDLLCNDALIKIRENDYAGALSLLEKSLKMAEQAMAEYDAASQFSETAPIKVQIAYVKQVMGDKAAAREILSQFDATAISDKVLRLLISNNVASLSDDLNAADANAALLYRELQFPSSLHNVASRLTVPQVKAMQRNELLLAQRAGKGLRNIAYRHAERFQGSLLGLSLVALEKTGIEFDDLPYDNNDKKVFRRAMNTDYPEVPFTLLAAQIAISYGNLQNAGVLLETLVWWASDDLLVGTPSVAPLLFYVYEKLDRRSSIVHLLNRLYDALITREITTTQEYKLLQFVAFQLLSVDTKKAKDLLKKPAPYDDEDSVLVNAILDDNTDSLPSVDSLTEGVDADQLLQEGLTPLLTNFKTVKANKSVHSKIEKKRKRAPRHLPRDTTKKIDEERWLPLKDRSYYHQKKSKQHKTQGGSADEALNISEQPSRDTGSSTQASSSKQKKSKKKKGRKH